MNATATRYMILLSDGRYVGATSVGALRPQPRAFGYVFDDRAEAEAIAADPTFARLGARVVVFA